MHALASSSAQVGHDLSAMSIDDETWEGLSSPASKRKRDQDEGPKGKKGKKKRRKTLKDDSDLDEEHHVNLAIGRLDPQLLADLVAKQTKKFNPDLTLIELESRQVPTRALVDTTGWTQSRILDKLPDFIRAFAVPDPVSSVLFGSPPENGAPHTLVVSLSGIRAADVTRSLREFQSNAAIVAKLFAKHIKLADAAAFVQKTRLSMGAGTPTRIIDLLETGALNPARLQQIIVDCSFIDEKKRSILGMKETHTSLVNLLSHSSLKQRYESFEDKLKVIFF